MSDGYLSDDKEMRLRQAAATPCRDCRHYTIRESWVLEGTQEGCNRVNTEVPNGEVVAQMMLRLAALSPCPSREPFDGLDSLPIKNPR